ncbi:hypothetical protein [Ferrimonas aestuarii]|uniref:MSHA biogenesis protein MshK n=1 Tax=Ferrimonas aestuarii TaxID=2569539 RepID=A0A4U1BP79_9GAMM|nr:hypothetical protein [Ferrimonas aestuarii]TKB55998.1 hypothetical protein FCL42_07200 [Ferrimonas aestuarii]
MLVRALLIPSLLLCASVQAQPLQDPTRPPSWMQPSASVEKRSPNAGVLQSILINGQSRIAVVSGEKYRESDPLMGSTISTITRDRVRLSDGRELVLFPKLGKSL